MQPEETKAQPKNDRYPHVKPLVYRLAAVEKAVSLKRTAIAQRLKAGDFPAPIKLGPRSKAWHVADIEAWLAGRPKNEAAG
jgi:prophage regulatory protein